MGSLPWVPHAVPVAEGLFVVRAAGRLAEFLAQTSPAKPQGVMPARSHAGASRYLSNSLPGVSELDKSDARSHASQKSCQPGVMPARSHVNQESSFNGLSSGQRAKRVEAPQRVPRVLPGPSQPSVGSPGFPAAGDSGEPVAGGDGRVRQ